MPLPVVIPLVIYNSSRPYNYSKNLFELFGDYGALMQEVFCNDFNLIDLSVIADKELRQDIWGGLTCFLMKHIHAKDIMSHLESMRSAFQLIEQQSGGKLITSMLTYIIDAGAISDDLRLDTFLNEVLSPKVGEEVMTYAEKLRLRGKAEGKVEAEAKLKLKVATKLLEQGGDVSYVARIVELTATEVKALQTDLVSC